MTEETKLQGDIIEALNRHPTVAFVRNNTVGMAKVKGRYISIGKKGDLDVYGMTTRGKYFEMEIKLAGKEGANKVRLEMQIQRVVFISNNFGIAGLVTSVEQAIDLIQA